MNKILALWAHPRARSTAFARMMLERGDFLVIDEPFGPYYYFSDERISHRRSDIEPQPEYRFDAIWQRLLQKNTFFSSHLRRPSHSLSKNKLAMSPLVRTKRSSHILKTPF